MLTSSAMRDPRDPIKGDSRSAAARVGSYLRRPVCALDTNEVD
jgi:hypothetical protein